MKKYLIRRLLFLIPIMLVLSFFVFALTYLSPSDPVTLKYARMGATPDKEMVERTKEEMGLNDPFIVQYAGLVVEEMNSCDLENAVHPYTRRLLQSVFSVNDRNRKVIPLEDMSVSGENMHLLGCPFAPRCPSALPECAASCPLLKEVKGGHLAACLALE